MKKATAEPKPAKPKPTALDRIVASARTKIKNRKAKLEALRKAFDEQAAVLNREIGEQSEILRELGKGE